MDSSVSGEFIVVLLTPLRLVLALTLIVASVRKLQDSKAFVTGVLQYEILPVPLARWYGRLLPAIEIGTGILFLLGIWLRPAAIVAAMMFASFALGVGFNLARKRKIPCYCFGADASDEIGGHTLIRIFLLLLVAISIAFSANVLNPLQSSLHSPSTADLINLVPVIFLTVFGLLILALVERSPWILRAWTVSPSRRIQPRISFTWRLRDGLSKELKEN